MSPRPPRNRVTTALSLSLSFSLRNLVAKTSRRDFGTRILLHRNLSLCLSALSYAQRGDFSFPRSTKPVSPPLPSFLPSFRANFSPPTWIANVDPPASQPARVETYVEMKFRFNFSRLLCVSMREEEGGKEINKKEGGR